MWWPIPLQKSMPIKTLLWIITKFKMIWALPRSSIIHTSLKRKKKKKKKLIRTIWTYLRGQHCHLPQGCDLTGGPATCWPLYFGRSCLPTAKATKIIKGSFPKGQKAYSTVKSMSINRHKTNAFQQNNNILLDDKAQSIPTPIGNFCRWRQMFPWLYSGSIGWRCPILPDVQGNSQKRGKGIDDICLCKQRSGKFGAAHFEKAHQQTDR